MLATVALSPVLLLTLSQPPSCADVSSCRQAAIEAAARSDFEAYHDLAWRTAQKGRPNDPELMYLLARAQSLSGRPGDALVMLRRLAQMGFPTDAGDNADFERVRNLPGWADLQALLASATDVKPALTAAAIAKGTATPAPSAAPAPPRTPAKAPASAPRAASSEADAPAGRRGTESALRLSATVNPVGLAYDSASRRFVVGDGDDNKLVIADEVFDHVNDLISATSGGFGRLSAVEIDARRGDLWVTSSDGNGSAAVHKLQLVSGRVLAQFAVPADLQPAVFSDFAISEDGTLVVLDSQGARLLRIATAGGRFERALALQVSAPSSIATVNGLTYVAHADGLSVVDTATGRVSAVRAAKGVSLAGLQRIRWGRNALFGIQGGGAASRVVKIRMTANGQRATSLAAIDGDMESAGTALTISRDAAYYVAKSADGPFIRRVAVQ